MYSAIAWFTEDRDSHRRDRDSRGGSRDREKDHSKTNGTLGEEDLPPQVAAA